MPLATKEKLFDKRIGVESPKPARPWSRYRALCFIMAGAIATIIIVGLIGEELDHYTVDDLGFVQLLGLAMVSVASLSCFRFAKTRPASRRFYLALGYILLIYALREADVHKAFVEHTHATKGEFYTDPDVPLASKIGCGAVLGLFAVVFAGFLIRNAKTFTCAILSFQPWALYVIAWGLVFIASQAIDKSPLNNTFWGKASEETLEAAAEAIVLYSVLAFPHRPKVKAIRSSI